MRTYNAAPQKASAAIQAYLRAVSTDPAVMEQHILGTGATASLEEKTRRYFGLPYAVAMCNATSALVATELALGLRSQGIVTTPFLYGASVSGALLLGNSLRFADVDASLNICPESVRRVVSSRTRAILSTDFNGVPADLEALRRVADEFGLWLVADAAQSFGAKLNGTPASSAADVVVTSLTCGKPLYAGEGAIALTRHKDVYERLLWYSQHPCRQRRELGLEVFNEFGMNFRIHPLAAVWANAEFDNALTEIHQAQERWINALSQLEASGIIHTAKYDFAKVCPSFFRVLVRQATPSIRAADIIGAARSLGLEARSTRLSPITRNTVFRDLHCEPVTRLCPTADAFSKTEFFRLSCLGGGQTC